MLPPNLRFFLFAFCLLIFDFCCAYPTPYSYTSTVFSRQETPLTSPVTVTRTQRITTGAGTFIQTCNITLTPTVVDGVNMVREEKTCVVTPDNGNGDTPSALPPPATSPIESPPLPSPPSPTLTTTSDLVSSTDILSSTDVLSGTGTVPPDPTVTVSPPPSSESASLPVVSITLTAVPRPTDPVSPLPSGDGSSSTVPPPDAPNPTPDPQPENTTSLADNLGSPSVPPLSPTPTSENAGASTPFDPPGKKLEVLPIGLGVFAGVSVVALFVVGIVTYERTKHRRNFRKLRLEEASNRMGYGAA